MSETTPKQKVVDTETSAMKAWLDLPINQRPEFVATGIPVADTSSQPKLK